MPFGIPEARPVGVPSAAPSPAPMRVLLAALLLAAAGCDASGLDADERAALRAGDVEVPLGQMAALAGVEVRFDAVVTDSRCPADAVCVWEGEAVVALRLNGRRAEVRVADPEREPDAGVRVGAVVVYAVALAPFPRADGPSDARPVVALSAVPA